ncbi:TPA: hypothetical protein HA251_00090 [Candidatus Woesearchaeota archaeon]|nr:hypothetical protein [Candidatus Woesearchaeota archaeon]
MDILGEKVTGRQLLKLSVDTIAAHQILQYAKHNDKEERIRMVSGLALLGIGYIYGPRLQEKIAAMKDSTLSDAVQERALYAAGGAMIGGIAGRYFDRRQSATQALPPSQSSQRHPANAHITEQYDAGALHTTQSGVRPAIAAPLIPPPIPTTQYRTIIPPPPPVVAHNGAASANTPTVAERKLQAIIDDAMRENDYQKPNGIILLGSIGWLGYSLFLNGKSKEDRTRHLWGLGAGAAGYAFGPEIIHKFDRLTLAKDDTTQANSIYRNGSMLLGAVIGGIAGWHSTDRIKQAIGIGAER